MANSFNGLGVLVKKNLKKEVENTDLFLFVNRQRTYLKVLYWMHDGYCIFSKKVPRGTFDSEDLPKELSIIGLEKLINEVIIHQGKKLRRLKVAA